MNVNVRTYYAEGSKTLAFEVAEQLGWEAPDHVVVPIASGSQLCKIAKGFAELHKVGLLAGGTDGGPPAVRVSGAQAEGCSPVATAFAEGTDFVRPVKPHTIAKSLAIGNPADGVYALDVVRASGGAIAAVTDAAPTVVACCITSLFAATRASAFFSMVSKALEACSL